MRPRVTASGCTHAEVSGESYFDLLRAWKRLKSTFLAIFRSSRFPRVSETRSFWPPARAGPGPLPGRSIRGRPRTSSTRRPSQPRPPAHRFPFAWLRPAADWLQLAIHWLRGQVGFHMCAFATGRDFPLKNARPRSAHSGDILCQKFKSALQTSPRVPLRSDCITNRTSSALER